MSGLFTETVTAAHAYTRAKSPWILEESEPTKRGRLVHYLSGGGMATFGRTIKQELVSSRHRRFLAVSAIIGVVYLVFYFV